MSRCRQTDSPGQAASCHSPRKKRTWWVGRLRDHNRVSTHRSRVARGRVMRGIHSGLKSTESCLFQPGLQVQSRARYDGRRRRASLALLAATALWNRRPWLNVVLRYPPQSQLAWDSTTDIPFQAQTPNLLIDNAILVPTCLYYRQWIKVGQQAFFLSRSSVPNNNLETRPWLAILRDPFLPVSCRQRFCVTHSLPLPSGTAILPQSTPSVN